MKTEREWVYYLSPLTRESTLKKNVSCQITKFMPDAKGLDRTPHVRALCFFGSKRLGASSVGQRQIVIV